MRTRLALAALALFLLHVSARADEVTLTSGFVQRTGRDVIINIVGTGGFSLSAFGDLAGPPGSLTFLFNTVTDASGQVIFGGLNTGNFRGGGSFTESFLTGSVSGYATNDPFLQGPPLFTVNFTGNGLLVIDTSGGVTLRTFLVGSSAPVPEPATLLLLGTGLTGVVGAARRRRRKG